MEWWWGINQSCQSKRFHLHNSIICHPYSVLLRVIKKNRSLYARALLGSWRLTHSSITPTTVIWEAKSNACWFLVILLLPRNDDEKEEEYHPSSSVYCACGTSVGCPVNPILLVGRVVVHTMAIGVVVVVVVWVLHQHETKSTYIGLRGEKR